MKTKLFAAVCLMIAVTLTATAQKHQTFKGVPIDGKTSVFVNQLKQKGFQTVGKSDTLTGTFAGYNNCEITILSSAQTDNVYGVKVQIPMCVPLSIYAEYKKLQAALTEKYGKPVYQTRQDDYTQKEDDFVSALYKMIADLKETFAFPYNCIFNTGCGNVLLNGAWRIPSECEGGFIIMTYLDNANNDLLKKSIYDDL